MTREEFIEQFKQMVIGGVYYNMPKDYRKSDEYTSKTIDEKYRQALDHSSIGKVLEDIMANYYYNKINEYEKILGY